MSRSVAGSMDLRINGITDRASRLKAHSSLLVALSLSIHSLLSVPSLPTFALCLSTAKRKRSPKTLQHYNRQQTTKIFNGEEH